MINFVLKQVRNQMVNCLHAFTPTEEEMAKLFELYSTWLALKNGILILRENGIDSVNEQKEVILQRAFARQFVIAQQIKNVSESDLLSLLSKHLNDDETETNTDESPNKDNSSQEMGEAGIVQQGFLD